MSQSRFPFGFSGGYFSIPAVAAVGPVLLGRGFGYDSDDSFKRPHRSQNPNSPAEHHETQRLEGQTHERDSQRNQGQTTAWKLHAMGVLCGKGCGFEG